MTTLVLPGFIHEEITERCQLPVESAAVMLARDAGAEDGDRRLLARSIHWIADVDYVTRTAVEMKIGPEAYLPALARSEVDGAIPIWFHTHPPGSSAAASQMDIVVDSQLADTFRIRSSSDIYGRLIAAASETTWNWTGALFGPAANEEPISRIWSVGDRWRLSFPEGASEDFSLELYDRNVRAFGPAIQRALSSLKVAVVGAGGTGSAVAEQLVRMGVRRLLLMDVDDLSLSNVTRVYGSSPDQVGRPKVQVLRDHLVRIAPDLDCSTLKAMATMRSSAERLTHSDVIFGCTDDNAGRLVLSRLSTYYLIPVIDIGVLLSSTADGSLSGIDGRVTVLSPGAACLVCRDRIDVARAAAEMQTPEERRRLADEGYAPVLEGREPAVVAFTTAVAAAAVNELLERMIGYGPDERPGEILLRMHEREISTNRAESRANHYCHASAAKWGAGGEEPFLGQLWPKE
jgi:molybdopterin/thiamine biosynthesis adenylyltransferase